MGDTISVTGWCSEKKADAQEQKSSVIKEGSITIKGLPLGIFQTFLSSRCGSNLEGGKKLENGSIYK